MSARLITASLLAAIAAALAATPASAAPGDLPRLTGAPASDIVPDWFDDHSVSSDNHLSWSPMAGEVYVNSSGQTSQREPKDIEWQSAINVSGPGGLELCGYPSGVRRLDARLPGGARRRLQPGLLSAAEPSSGRFGWFRYVYGRHPEALNRWHVMDLERSALVPLTPAVPTLWDNHWGTCLNLDSGSLNCVATATRRASTSAWRAARRPRRVGEVDAQTIPLTVETALTSAQRAVPARHPHQSRTASSRRTAARSEASSA